MSKNIFIFKNDTEISEDTEERLIISMNRHGFNTCSNLDDADFIACIGGDGTLLRMVQECDFPAVPIIGINTGHLGFFQEFEPEHIDEFMTSLEADNYQLQIVNTIRANIESGSGTDTVTCLNDILIRGPFSHITHLNVVIGNTTIQEFSGDGILFCTPVGSTAYNYSLRGAIISPDLEVFQMTPVAPSNTNAYRCFPSSIMYSDNHKVTLTPVARTEHDEIMLAFDGVDKTYSDVSRIEITKSDKRVRIVRFTTYDYWSKLTAKLL